MLLKKPSLFLDAHKESCLKITIIIIPEHIKLTKNKAMVKQSKATREFKLLKLSVPTDCNHVPELLCIYLCLFQLYHLIAPFYPFILLLIFYFIILHRKGLSNFVIFVMHECES